MDTLLCPPLLSSSCCVKFKLLLKGKKAPDSVGNQCPTPVWLLGTTREKVEQLLCLGLCFLLGHCSRKVALQPDRCTLAARDDNSTMCPAGNTPGGFLWWSWIPGVRGLKMGLVWSHPMEGSAVTSKSIGVLCWHFTSSVVNKNSLLWLTPFNLKD